MPDARMKSNCKACRKWFAYKQTKREYRHGGRVVVLQCPLCDRVLERLPRKIDGKWGMNL